MGALLLPCAREDDDEDAREVDGGDPAGWVGGPRRGARETRREGRDVDVRRAAAAAMWVGWRAREPPEDGDAGGRGNGAAGGGGS